MDRTYKEEIAKKLSEKGVNKPCPRCNSLNFEVIGQTFLWLNDDPQILNISGPSIPSAIIACSRCGFITLHAISALSK